MKRKVWAMAAVAGGALAGGLMVGDGISGAANRPSTSPGIGSSTELSTAHRAYQVNAKGQTYGPGLGAMSDAQMPDLVQAYATNGKTGYVRASDLDGPQLTLEQVRALPTNAQGQLHEPARSIPVYAQDGSTVIGTFVIQ